MNIIMTAAECVPFIKAGGLADVMGSLPKALVELGHEVQVVLPKYDLLPAKYEEQLAERESVELWFKGEKQLCPTFGLTLKGVEYIFVENEALYARGKIYGEPDDHLRFAYLSRAVLAILETQKKKVDILHVHDWHTAIIPFLLQEDDRYAAVRNGLKTVLTIHNLQFQGQFPKEVFTDDFGMDASFYDDGKVEWKGRFNHLKAGILYADQVTTVSPSYRNEILTARYGEGLEPLLEEKGEGLIGILNGLDTEFYNPATDLVIEMEYDHTTLERKAVNKRAIQQKFGLPERGDIPLLTMVSRLSGQKGVDVLQEFMPEMMKAADLQFVLLGSGEAQYEEFFRGLSEEFPEKVKVHIGFDEDLAHLLYAGADIFLMPSHFEPCGLSQLISMRYGTVPIANKTGGLKDTVIEYDPVLRSGNGFLSDFAENKTFEDALKRGFSLYQQESHWDTIKQNGMQGDYSWARSAKEYADVYKGIAEG